MRLKNYVLVLFDIEMNKHFANLTIKINFTFLELNFSI